MKTEVSNLVKHLKKLAGQQQINPSSVGFQSAERGAIVKPKLTGSDFLQELKDAISSGDDSIWRMWR